MKTNTPMVLLAALLLSAPATAQTGRKISDWPTASSIAGTDVVIGNQAGATKQIPLSLLASLYQPLDSDLTAIASLSTTAFGRSFLADADAAATRARLSLGSLANLDVPAAGVLLSNGSILAPATLGSGLRLSGSTLSADRVSSLWDATMGAIGLTVDDRGVVLANSTTGLVPGSQGLTIYGFGNGLVLGAGTGTDKLGFYGATAITRPGGSLLSAISALGLVSVPTIAAGDISSGLLPIARGGTGTGSPGLVAGSGVSITGSWPNQTISATASSAWADITGKPSTLSGYGITDAQPLDSDLTSIAALTTTTYGRSLLTQADAPTARTTLGLATVAATGAYADLSGRPSLATIATSGLFADIASKPTTLSGYGITDAQPLNSALTSWAAVTRASGFDTFVATPSGANLAAVLSSALPTSKGGTGLTSFTAGVDYARPNTVQTWSGAANVTVSSTTRLLRLTADPGADRTITLPAASAFAGGEILWIDLSPVTPYFTRNVDLVRAGSDTIRGATANWRLHQRGRGGVTGVISDGTSNWAVFAFLTEHSDDNSGGASCYAFMNNGSNGVLFMGPPSGASISVNGAATPARVLMHSGGFFGIGSGTNNIDFNASADVAWFRSAAGVWEATDGASGGFARTKTGWVVTPKTSSYTVVLADKGTVFTNEGATGSVNFTLPAAQAGLQFTFIVDAAQTVTVTAGASTTIRIAGSVSASAGNITTSTVGATVRLIAISSTKWVAESSLGTWTVN